MKTIHFFVEDKTHKFFLQQFTKHFFNHDMDLKLDFNMTHSWGGITTGENKQKILELVKDNIPFIVFIDSDIEYPKRKKELDQLLSDIKKELKITFPEHSFLFPDNATIGNIETLLTYIAKETSIIECFKQYESCITKTNFNPPQKKSKIYAYLEALDPEKMQDHQRDYLNTSHWDLMHSSLNPLKTFLSPFFTKI